MVFSARSNSAFVMSWPLTRATTAGSCAGTGLGASAAAGAALWAAGLSFSRPSASAAPFGDASLHPTRPTTANNARAGTNVSRDISLEYDVQRVILNVLFGLR